MISNIDTKKLHANKTEWLLKRCVSPLTNFYILNDNRGGFEVTASNTNSMNEG